MTGPPHERSLHVEADADPRFSMGLVFDVRDVLEAHGYRIPDGGPLLALQLGLFHTLYPKDTNGHADPTH